MSSQSSSSVSERVVVNNRKLAGTSSLHSVADNRKSLCMPYFEEFEPRRYYCIICREKNINSGLVIKRNNQSSTTNFWNHLKKYHEDTYQKLKGRSTRGAQRTIVDYVHHTPKRLQRFRGITFEQTKDLLVKYVSITDQPWTVVDRRIFRELLWYSAQDEYQIPSSRALRDYASVVYETEKQKLKTKLKSVRRVSLSVDAWMSDNYFPLLGMTVHWVDDEWNLQGSILNIAILEGPHSGKNMAALLRDTLNDFCLETKVTAIMTDNASNNDTMVEDLVYTLKEVNPDFDRNRHMPCVAHVINLMVQDCLQRLDIKEAWTSEQTVALVEDCNSMITCTTSTSVCDLVYRVRQLVAAVRSSSQKRDQFKEFCRELRVADSSFPVLDVPTRWNSTHDMLIGAYEKRAVLNKMALLVLSDATRNYTMTDAEWELVQHVASLLKPFREAIQYLCQMKVVTATGVLKLMKALQGRVRRLLESIERCHIFPPGLLLNDEQRTVVMSVCEMMLEKMETYEKRMKGNTAFAIAALVDPQVKLNPIDTCDHDKIKADVSRLLKDVIENPSPYPRSTECVDGKAPFYYREESLTTVLEEMDAPPISPSVSVEEELATYLRLPSIKENALSWWKREGRYHFPRLAAVAKEFLPVCATSSPAERFFSSSRGILTYKQASLAEETQTLLMTLKCWLRQTQPELFDLLGDNIDAAEDDMLGGPEGW